MATRTRGISHLNHALLANDIALERHDPVYRYRHSRCAVRLQVPEGLNFELIRRQRGIEHHLPGPNPVLPRPQRRRMQRLACDIVIPKDLRFALLEPLHVVGRFVTGSIDRVAAINRADRDAVIELAADVPRRSFPTRKRRLKFVEGLMTASNRKPPLSMTIR